MNLTDAFNEFKIAQSAKGVNDKTLKTYSSHFLAFSKHLDWFYCLPLSIVYILVVLAAMLFLLLRSRLGVKPYWRASVFLLFVCSLFVIYFGTLGYRTEGGSPSKPI